MDYEKFFAERIGELKAEGRYRVFADLAVERGLVPRERIDECIEILGKMREMGLESSIQEVLLKKGYLTEAQVKVVGKVPAAEAIQAMLV